MKILSRIVTALVLALVIAVLPVHAGPWQVLKTIVRSPYTRDAVIFGSYMAVAATEPCYKPRPCSDQSFWFPAHPTHPQVWIPCMGQAFSLAATNHLLYYVDKDPKKETANVVGWMFLTVPVATDLTAYDLRSNLTFKYK